MFTALLVVYLEMALQLGFLLLLSLPIYCICSLQLKVGSLLLEGLYLALEKVDALLFLQVLLEQIVDLLRVLQQ